MRRWLTGLVILLMFAAVWVPQWIAYESTSRQLREEIERRRQQRAALEVTAKKEAEFQEQVKLLAAKLEKLAMILPPTLDSESFLTRFGESCRALGFTIVERSTDESPTGEDHREATVQVTLTGDYKRLPALQEQTHAMARLVAWKGETPIVVWHDGVATAKAYQVELAIYAWPASERPMKPCVASPEAHAVWPFSRHLATLHREAVQLCEEIDRFDTLRGQVEAFQQRKKRLEDQIAFIEKVRAKRGPA